MSNRSDLQGFATQLCVALREILNSQSQIVFSVNGEEKSSPFIDNLSRADVTLIDDQSHPLIVATVHVGSASLPFVFGMDVSAVRSWDRRYMARADWDEVTLVANQLSGFVQEDVETGRGAGRIIRILGPRWT